MIPLASSTPENATFRSELASIPLCHRFHPRRVSTMGCAFSCPVNGITSISEFANNAFRFVFAARPLPVKAKIERKFLIPRHISRCPLSIASEGSSLELLAVGSVRSYVDTAHCNQPSCRWPSLVTINHGTNLK